MNSIFKRIVAAVLCLTLCCSGLTTWVHADTDIHDHYEDAEWSASSACSHKKYEGLGVCTSCGYKYDWASTRKTADAGKYYITKEGNGKQPHVGDPYGAANYDTSVTFKTGDEVTVKASVTNAHGNKWYEFSYGNGKTGYMVDTYLKKCSHKYTEKITKEATCQKDGKATYTCSYCSHSYTGTVKSDGKHKYEGQGVCKWCGYVFQWTLNKADAGIYIAVDEFYPRTKVPYDDSAKDYLDQVKKGEQVKVKGSLINAYGNKWYQITYGNNETGYVAESQIKLHKCDYSSKVTVEATCVMDGTKTFTCKICKHTYTETIKSKGTHEYIGEGVCSVCGYKHTWTLNTADAGTYIATDTFNPRTTSPYQAAPADSGKTYKKGQEVTVTGSLENAHKNKWYQISYDGKIGYVFEDHLIKCSHSYKEEVIKEVTCQADGKIKYTCSKCSHSKTEVVKSDGKHKYDDYGNCKWCGTAFKWTLNKDDAGMYIVQDICSPHKSGPYKAHEFDLANSMLPGKVVKVNGSLINAFNNKWYQISYDGKTGYLHEDHLKPCKHDYETEVTKEATCKDDGQKTHTCKVCGYVDKETVKATGKHKYAVNGKCTWCGVAYEWKLNTADAGTYLVTKLITVFTEPYLVSGVDATAIYQKGQAVKVTGSLINSEGNKWYQVSYGGGKIGYIYKDYLTKCKHEKYEKDGRCSACGDAFVWKLNTADAGTYTAVDAFNPRVGPYEVTKKDTNTNFVKGNGVKVTGSLTNAFGNKWYEISYGNGKTGYVYSSHLILCSHSYNTKVTKEATCAAEGSKTHTCSKCSYSYKETIKKLSHSWKNATCTVPKTCTACGATDGKALGHSWVAATVTTPKTCSVCGVTEGGLAVCTHSYQGTVEKAATCTEEGIRNNICTVCGHSYTEPIPKLSHSWEAATCFAPKTCTECGTTEGTALTHIWTGIAEEKKCEVCGLEGDDSDVPHTHTWVDATCTAPKTCSECGATEGTALDHTWTAATCATPKTCSKCGVTEGAALGHSQEGAFRNDDKQHWINCRVCDQKVAETIGNHSGDPCSICGYSNGDQPADPPADGIWGDADSNRMVNAKDAMLVLQYYTKKITADKLNTTMSDVDGNDTVNAKDAMLILQYYTKKITSFPVEGTTDKPAECAHTWVDATYQAPKTCSKCGATEGEPLKHSALYVEGVSVEDVLTYFEEVVVDTDTHGGRVQKWESAIYYEVHGNPTDADLKQISDFAQYLNSIEGFPGFYKARTAGAGNLQIYFCDVDTMVGIMGEDSRESRAAVVYSYYTDNNEIALADVCVLDSLGQTERNSVILTELMGALGFIKYTTLRQDSILNETANLQALSAVDELLLKLVYGTQIDCNMNKSSCEAVIRKLYY